MKMWRFLFALVSYFLIVLTHVLPSPTNPYLRNATYHGLGPREEARAMCSVKTQELLYLGRCSSYGRVWTLYELK
ncbi:unnamed protein product [Leptidea sinapis]|uniref:Secreted protein n=1 Tax=Leptidea sinapis TaxID=189913 RepID=A0A5E4PP93_9NEOP|nr:unnamed protein product [Leptidea sinapis]